MKIEGKNNVSNSGETSPTAAPSIEQPALSEAEFLRRQSAQAKAAISETLAGLGKNLKGTVDPHLLTRDHPWIAISAAAAAGFAAAVTLIPSKEQQALKALAELERARHAPPPAPPAAGASDKAEATAGVLGFIAAEGVKMLRPLLTTLLTAGINRAANTGAGNGAAVHDAPSSAPADGNGHASEENIPSPS